MIKFTVYIPSLFLSSDLPDITIATDHEAVNFRISIGSAVLLEGRYYAFNGNITVSDIVPLIQDNIAGNIDMNLVDVHLEAFDGDESDTLDFPVLYSNKLTGLYDPSDWLRENFLTLSHTRRLSPDGYINVSWYAANREGVMFRVYATFINDKGLRDTYQYAHSGNGQIAHSNGVLTEYIMLEALRDLIIERKKIESLILQSVTVRCGNRSATFFIDPALETNTPIFYLNCFGITEHIALPRTTTVKVKTDRSLASVGKTSQFYDISTSKEYEVESGPLTSDECIQIEQMLTSPSVRIPFGQDCSKYDTDFDALRPILITDYTCEFSDTDEKLNKVKFTWRFADNTPSVDMPTTPGIFNQNFNPTFS